MTEAKHSVIANSDHLLVMIQLPCECGKVLPAQWSDMKQVVEEAFDMLKENVRCILGQPRA